MADEADDPHAQDPRQPSGHFGDPNQAIPVLPPEIAERIPPDVQRDISAFFMRLTAGPANPIAEKVTPEHIDKALEIARGRHDNEYEYAKGQRWFQFAVYLTAIAVFVFLVVFLVDKPTILAPTLTALLGFASGFGIGRTVGR